MKISDMVISALLKKGILYEAKNVDVEFNIPKNPSPNEGKDQIKVHVKADQMSIRIEKDET